MTGADELAAVLDEVIFVLDTEHAVLVRTFAVVDGLVLVLTGYPLGGCHAVTPMNHDGGGRPVREAAMLSQDDRHEMELIANHSRREDPNFTRARAEGRLRLPSGDGWWPLVVAAMVGSVVFLLGLVA